MGVTTQSGEIKQSTVFFFPELELPNVAFRNRGDLTFEEVSQEWAFNTVDISQAMALGDLDNDGDLDIVVMPSVSNGSFGSAGPTAE